MIPPIMNRPQIVTNGNDSSINHGFPRTRTVIVPGASPEPSFIRRERAEDSPPPVSPLPSEWIEVTPEWVEVSPPSVSPTPPERIEVSPTPVSPPPSTAPRTPLQTAWQAFNEVYNDFTSRTSVGQYYVENGFQGQVKYYIQDLEGDTIGEAKNGNVFLDIDYILEADREDLPGAIMSLLAHEVFHLFDDRPGEAGWQNNSIQEEFSADVAGELAAYEAYYSSLSSDFGEEGSAGDAYLVSDIAHSNLYAWNRAVDGLGANANDPSIEIFRRIYPRSENPRAYQLWNDDLAEMNSFDRRSN